MLTHLGETHNTLGMSTARIIPVDCSHARFASRMLSSSRPLKLRAARTARLAVFRVCAGDAQPPRARPPLPRRGPRVPPPRFDATSPAPTQPDFSRYQPAPPPPSPATSAPSPPSKDKAHDQLTPSPKKAEDPPGKEEEKPVAVAVQLPTPVGALSKFERVHKEDFRKRRRNVFGAAEWRRHRSNNRYVRHFTTMFNSSVIKGLLPPVGFFAFIAALLSGVDAYLDPAIFEGLPIQPPFKLPMAPFNTTASALSLLLVFRTNASYDRWWEARKIWGGLLNRSRDYVRQGITWFDENDQDLKSQLVRYTVAFTVALKVHLRPDEEDMREELKSILNEKELELAMSKAHVPNHLLRMHSAIVNKAGLNPILQSAMDGNITDFEDDLGKCERIFKTPIPMAYTRMTSRFLILWLMLLPLAMWESSGWMTVPLEAFIAFLLLGIEEIGVQIEEPFSIISCEGICESVRTNCNAMLETDRQDRSVVANRFDDQGI